MTTPASDVTTQQPYPNAVQRTQLDKNTDIVSIKDFGAVGDGVTDNIIALTNAMVAAKNRTLFVPMDVQGGNYIIASGTLTIPNDVAIIYEKGALLNTTSNAKIVDNGRHFHLFSGLPNEYRSDTRTEGLCLEINSPITGTGASSTYMLNRIFIKDDRVDALSDNVAGSKVDGLIVQHNFGGVGAKGGRHAGEFILSQNAPTDADNTDTNYVGVAGVVVSNSGDGGKEGVPRGEYFAFNAYAVAQNAPYLHHLNGCESNAIIGDEVSSVKYRCGYSAVSGGVKQATDYDCAYAIGALDLSGAKWKYGILAGRQNGRSPVDTCLIRVEYDGDGGQGLVSYGSDIPFNLITSDTDNRFKFTVNTLQMFYPNANIQLGNKSQANTPYFDFFTGEIIKAGRIIINNSSAGENSGTLNLQFRQTITQDLLPSLDNVYILGAPTLRWNTIYAGTGTINTSDERLKKNWAEIEAAEKRAALKIKSVIKRYQFKDSVSDKGDKARYHFGVGAQTVAQIMIDEGLDPTQYAFYCYDEWQAQDATFDEKGEVIQPPTIAGNRYGIRYDELAMFILASI